MVTELPRLFNSFFFKEVFFLRISTNPLTIHSSLLPYHDIEPPQDSEIPVRAPDILRSSLLTLEELDASHETSSKLCTQPDKAASYIRISTDFSTLCDIEKGRQNVSIELAASIARKSGLSEILAVECAIQDALHCAGLKMDVKIRKSS